MGDTLYWLQLAAVFAAATLLAWWCGWGLARLALPQPLAPYRAALAPLLGYAAVVVAGYWLVRAVAGTNLAAPLLILAAGALNLLAWRHTGRPTFRRPGREALAVAALLLITSLAGIAPLLSYGQPAIIGAGWDPENYLPLARYLERGPISAIAEAASNPLRDLNARPPAIGLTIGFSIWHSSVSLLTQVEALTSFAPLIAWLRALGILGVYLLLRATLGLRPPAALLGAAWTSAGALLLWTGYFNFGMQIGAWPLLPLGLLIGLAAAEDLAARGRAAWPGALGAALGIAALPVTYYPALTLWLPAALALAVTVLLAGPRRPALAGAGIAVGLGALLLAAPTLLDYFAGFSYYYGGQLTTVGVRDFIPLSDIVGLTPYQHAAPVAPPTPPWAWAALALLGGLMLAALGHPRRGRWLALGLAACAYLGWLRLIEAYPYAYMKGAAYAGFLLLGMAAAGVEALHDRLPARVRPLVWALPLLLLAPMAVSQAQMIARHTDAPGLYGRSAAALLDLRRLVPPGSTVTMTSDPRVQGPPAAIAAYALDHAVVWGQVRTGYASFAAGAPDALADYALLAASEDPAPWGYHDLVWQRPPWALYRRPPGALAFLSLQAELTAGQETTLSVGATSLAAGTVALPGTEPRGVTLAVTSFAPGTLLVDGQTYAVPAGLSHITLGSVAPGTTLALRNAGPAPLTLQHATLHTPEAPPAAPGEHVLLLHAQASVQEQQVTSDITALLRDGGPVVVSLAIWEERNGTQQAWYGIELAPRADVQRVRLAIDLRTGRLQATGGDGAAIPAGVQFAGLPPGDYRARLMPGAGPYALAAPLDLFRFTVHSSGRIDDLGTLDLPVQAITINRPPQRLDVRVGTDVRLVGYTLPERVRPGETLDCILWWRVEAGGLDERSVLVALVDARGERRLQADGPPAGGRLPTSQWRAGDVVLDARQVMLPPDLPPGRYTLEIGMYRWPSLERLPLSREGQLQPDNVLRVPLIIR